MFLFKVKSHRGEPTHEEADFQEDKAILNKDTPMERGSSLELGENAASARAWPPSLPRQDVV